MKYTLTSLKRTLLLLLVTAVVLPATVWTQNKKNKTTDIKNIVEARNYTFVAQTVLPSAGGSRQLTTDFDLQVAKDTIMSNLPYFGRGYSAPINPAQGPLEFTSTNFDYKVTTNKKGGWDIVITTKDQQDRKQLTLSVFNNGNASASVISNNQQPISFTGYVKARK